MGIIYTKYLAQKCSNSGFRGIGGGDDDVVVVVNSEEQVEEEEW